MPSWHRDSEVFLFCILQMSSPSSSSSSPSLKPCRNTGVLVRQTPHQRYLAKLVAFHNHRTWRRGLDENDELGTNLDEVTDNGDTEHGICSRSDESASERKNINPTVIVEDEDEMAKENHRGRLNTKSSSTPTPSPSLSVTTTPNSPSTLTATAMTNNSSNSFFSVCTSRLSPSTSKCTVADVSPQILRRIQWQMKNRKNKHSPNRTTSGVVEHPAQYQSEQQSKYQQPVVTGGRFFSVSFFPLALSLSSRLLGNFTVFND